VLTVSGAEANWASTTITPGKEIIPGFTGCNSCQKHSAFLKASGKVLNMTILADHDVMDGAPMVRFLNDLTNYIEKGILMNE